MKVPQRLQRYLAQAFSIDLRTLALFRAAVGSVLCATLLLRFCDLGAFYADAGVLPRAELVSWDSPLRVSAHLANGSALFAGLVLAVQGLAAFCLATGYRTRCAAVLSWLLLASLHGRNPLVLTSADDLLLCLLFWAMFLPLAARWSVDAALSAAPPPEDPDVLSWASAGLVLQVLSAWFFGALAMPEPAGPARVLHGLGLAAPVLALSPVLNRPLRFTALVLLALAQPALALLGITSGYWPYVSLAGLTVLLGGAWWDRQARRRDHGRHLRIYYDQDCTFCLKSCLLIRHLLVLPRTEILGAQGSPRAHALMQAQDSWVVIDGEDVAHTQWNAWVALVRHSLLFGWAWRLVALRFWERPGNAVYSWVARHRGRFGVLTAALLPMRDVRFGVPAWTQAVAGVALVAVLAWNLASVNLLPAATLRVLAPVLYPVRLDQRWHLLEPAPGPHDGWFVAPGQFADGTDVDVLQPARSGVDYARPATAPNVRWQAWFARLHHTGFQHLPYSRYLCREWTEGGRPLARFKMIYMFEEARADGSRAPVEQHVLWQHDCAP